MMSGSYTAWDTYQFAQRSVLSNLICNKKTFTIKIEVSKGKESQNENEFQKVLHIRLEVLMPSQ